MPKELEPFLFNARQLAAALSLPGVYNQIRGKRPEAYVEIVNRRAAELERQKS